MNLSTIAQVVIFTLIILATIITLYFGYRELTKPKPKSTITRSARTQAELSGRRVKK